jgi:2-oxoglutarate dehydrogenase E2 component (dihydrolipoamide succinyltransferase)
VNAPEAGTIKEFLVNEEDTVTVGQDLVKLEAGGEPSGGQKQEASSETKEAAPKDQETSSQPSGEQEQSAPKEESAPKQEEKQAEQPKQESKPEPPKQEQKPQPPKKESKPAPKEESKPVQPGSREERRVRLPAHMRANSR